ncbi:MAG: PaaI family thioesterase [Chloroflexota bacterium]
MKLKFYETAPGEIEVNYIVPDRFQGYPGIVHGGITAALVDEALGRVHMGSDPKNVRFMYTAKLNVQYRKPVPIGKPIRIVAQAIKTKRRSAMSEAQVFGPGGNLLIEAEAILVDVPPEALDEVDLEDLGWKVYPD